MSDTDAVLMTPEQIAELGLPALGEGEAYMDVFVINDKMTNSGWHEGGPWQVPTAILDKVGETVIGRPFLVGPDPNSHLRAASGTAEDQIKMQEKYAVGEFVKTFKRNGNIRGAVKLFKEFVDRARRGLLPKYSSPMVDPDDFNPLTRQVSGGRILHVQAVGTSGFDPTVAKLGPVCVGMLDKCMNKLRTLAASGSLADYQNKIQDMADNSLDVETPDEQSEMETKQIASEVVAHIIKNPEQAKALLAAAGPDAVQELLKKTEPETGANSSTEQEDRSPVKAPKKTAPKADAEGDTAQENDKPAEVDMENHPVVKALRKEVDDLKADKADRERSDVIRELVDLEAQLHVIDASKRADRIKHYKELKGDDGSIVAFRAMIKTYTAEKKKLLGAAGLEAGFPQMHMGGSDGETTTDDLVEAFDSVRRVA